MKKQTEMKTIQTACGHSVTTSANVEKVSLCPNCEFTAKFGGGKIEIKNPELLEDRHRQQAGA